MLYGSVFSSDANETIVVLILIFLENALRQGLKHLNLKDGWVLILIFLENALRLNKLAYYLPSDG